MKNLPTLALCLGLFAALTVPLIATKDKGLDVLLSADAIASPEGFRPKPGQPIHYVYSQKSETLGDAIAGIKLPEPAFIERAIVAELAKQGFIRTQVGGPIPDIVILAIVGDANFEQPPLPSTFINPLFEPDFGPYLQHVNLRKIVDRNLLSGRVPATVEQLFAGDFPSPNEDINQARDLALAEAIRLREIGTARARDRSKILGLVGAPKVDQGVKTGALKYSAGERIASVTKENRYYVTLSAFDAVRWRSKEQVHLWRTTMLIDWREDFSGSLEEMLAQAGPLFGTDVIPGFVNTAKSRQTNVEIGEAKVVTEKAPPAATNEGKK